MPTSNEIRQVAFKVTDLLESAGISVCLCGEAAFLLYGCSTVPDAVDFLVTSKPYDPERLKEWIAGVRPSEFFLQDSVKPESTHKVLFCRTKTAAQRECKVNFLVPGVLNIPDIPQKRFGSSQNIPVMPLFPLLLLRVQTWVLHSASTELKERKKIPYDVKDVDRLVRIAIARSGSLAGVSSWLPSDFLDIGRTHVAQYRQGSKSSLSSGEWRRIGF